MAKRDTRTITQQTRDLAMAAGETIGQAALNVTHLAVNRARAAVALADQTMYGRPAAKPKRRKAKTAKAKTAVKRRVRAAGTVAKKSARKAMRPIAKRTGRKAARKAKK